jgi:hypothetical protein
MNLNTHSKLRLRPWDSSGHLEPIKVIGLLIVALVPGGLMLPVCYAVYGAIRKSFPARSIRR